MGYTCEADYVDKAVDPDTCISDVECATGTYCDLDGIRECVKNGGREVGRTCSDWYQCESGRCDVVAGECVAASALADEGDVCVLNPTYETVIAMDPCKDSLYCKRNDPTFDDMNGTCVKQIATGDLCDRGVNSETEQCEGNARCILNSTLEQYICPVPTTDKGGSESCTLSAFGQNTW